MNLAEIRVSFFKNVFDKQPKEVSLSDVIKNIKANEKIEGLCNQLKRMPVEGDVRAKFKEAKFPAITVSGTFRNGHKAAQLVKHSNLIQVDFDKVENLNTMAEQLKADKFTFVQFISPSGTGIKIFVLIDGAKHLDSFTALQSYYKAVYGLIMDKKCKDVGRPCFLSNDKGAFVNESAAPFIQPWPIPEKTTVLQSTDLPAKTCKNKGVGLTFQNNDTESEVKLIVERIKESRTDITQGYENWLKIGFALANGLGERGRAYFHDISSLNTQYVYDEADKQYSKCINANNTGATIKSFFGIAKQYGVNLSKSTNTSLNFKTTNPIIIKESKQSDTAKSTVEAGKNANSKKGALNIILQVQAFLKENFDLRYNEVSNRIEEKKKGDESWKDLNESNIYIFLLENNYNISQAKLTALLRSDFVKIHNPFKSYFENLVPYDKLKEPDYIQNLSTYVYAKNQERFATHLKKHLVRTVACSINNQYYNKQAFIIIHDKQNSGKSTFCRWFCPPLLERYLGENVNLSNKDGEIALSEKFIINLDELAALSKYEINQLKSVMSRDRISVRRPFDKSTSDSPRRCSFLGSTNRTEFLSDETGSVRWLCFEIELINWDYKKDIDINRLWSQAFALYNEGFKYDLTSEEIAENELANEQFFISTPEEELLLRTYSPGTEKENDAFMTATEIITKLSEKVGTAIRMNPVNMGKVLKKQRFIKTSQRIGGADSIKGYFIKHI